MKDYFSEIGALRTAQGLFILILMISAFFTGDRAAHSGLAMWPTLIAPALAPMFIFILPLDITMSMVKKDGAETRERARLNKTIVFNLVLLAGLVISWLPFFLGLLQR